MSEPESLQPRSQGQWWVRTPAGQFGPVDLATLRLWVQQRRVGPNDFVCNPATGAWTPAQNEPQLAGCFAPLGAVPFARPMIPSAKRSNGCLIAALVGVGLLVVVPFLAGMLLPPLARAREQARRARCLANIKQLGLAMKQYSQDFGNTYPWRRGGLEPYQAWHDPGMLFPNYCTSMRSFYCPSSDDRMWDSDSVMDKIENHPLDPFDMSGSTEVISYSYGHNNQDGELLPWTESAPPTVRLLADKKAATDIGTADNPERRANHKDDGRNVVYNDGHAIWRAGPRALDPDEDSDETGARYASEYGKWWSDPPYYNEFSTR